MIVCGNVYVKRNLMIKSDVWSPTTPLNKVDELLLFECDKVKILTCIECFSILKRLELSNKIIEMYRVIGKDYINTMEREFYLRC